MSAYRFCRSDDVALLVQAYNDCYHVHFPEQPQMTVEAFRERIREQNLWTSSCMIAVSGDRPVGVMLAAKRPEASRILALGIQTGHQGRGHGRHMLASLARKLAILGPRRMLIELPSELERLGPFLEHCGYAVEGCYTDFTAHPQSTPAPANELIFPVALETLLELGVLEDRVERCWERSATALRNLGDRVRGLALGSGERIEAHLLYHEPPGEAPREILAIGCADADRAPALLGLLVARFCGSSTRPVRIRCVGEGEIDFGLLASWGFEPTGRTVRYAMEAEPD